MSKKLKLVIGSTRQNRNAKPIADWFAEKAKAEGYNLEILDLKEINLPKFEAGVSPMYQPVDTPEAKAWAKEISEADGLVFLTAEYNRSIPGSLKDAIDYLYSEWNDKPVSIISYGWIDGGGSATKHLKDILGWVKTKFVGPDVAIKFNETTFDESFQFKDINSTLGEVSEDFIGQLKALSE